MSKILIGFLLFAFSAGAMPQTRQLPIGVRQAGEATEQAERTIPPPTYQAPGPNLEQLQQQAQELATLAHSIPPDIGQFSKGVRPKDLDERLKKIEKLSKHLRSELNRM